MIILISGASHTGKTNLAQKLLQKYSYPYLSIDHLKMGLIRSGNTDLTPMSADRDLTAYLWPIVCEIIKTAIENNQNLIVEGCYIPFNWAEDFDEEYLSHIRYFALVMSESYIKAHIDNIKKYESVIEKRLVADDFSAENLIADNRVYLENVQKYDLPFVFIDDKYEVDFEL